MPADAVLAAASNLLVDESLLTGEAIPVRKSAGDGAAAMARPGGEDLPFVFSGTLVVGGEGVAIVRSTGAASEIGKIGQALGRIVPEPPRLQQQTRRLVRNFAVVGMATSLLAVLLYGFLRGDWLKAILGGIALGMSMLPEEFPLVLTAFMVMGAWRLSQARVLTRRAAAIEMLGSATVLCTDKTGTLTENRMTIADLRTPATPGDQARLVETALLASARESFDPMERAIKGEAETRMGGTESIYAGRELVRQYGLHPGLLAMTNVWRRPDGETVVCAKGAPEAIGLLCRLDPERLAWLHAAVDAMAEKGVRVLGVARAAHPEAPNFPETQHGLRLRIPRPDRLHRPTARQRARCGTRVPLGRRAGRDDYRRLSGDRRAIARALASMPRALSAARSWQGSMMPPWPIACEPPRSLPASCRSRSCASSRC